MKPTFLSPLRKPGAILALAAACALGSGAAHAVPIGTPANTDITNLATLTYSVGAVPQAAIGSSESGNTSGTGSVTSFKVDNKINLTVVTSDSTYVSVVPGQTTSGATVATASQVATFTVTNTGNSTQDFSLTPLFAYSGSVANVFAPAGVIDNFDPTSCVAKVESGGTAGYDPTDTVTYVNDLASGDSQTVYVICAIPTAQLEGDIAAISLTAKAFASTANGTFTTPLTEDANTQSAVEVVFADIAGPNGIDAARDAQHSALSAFRVKRAKLKVTKTVAPVCDPLNGNTGPKNIPGSFVRYTITVENTGAVGDPSAILSSIGDTLTTLVTFDNDLIQGTSAATCVAASTPENALGKGFKIVNAGRLAAGGSYPKYLTTTVAGADGADATAGVITVNFATVLPATDPGTYAAGELKLGESVSVIYQVQIN